MERTEKDNSAAPKKDKPTLEFVSLKSQKLTSALYLLSGSLSDQDPLKWQMRKQALAVLSEVLTARRNAGPDNISLFDGAIAVIGHLVALIDVALAGQGVSRMNFSILRGEYISLQEQMVAYQLGLKDELVAGSAPASPYLVASFEAEARLAAPKPVPKPAVAVGAKPAARAVSQGGGQELTDRRQVIIEYVRKNGWSSIKDIAQALPQVSTKTVQRELVEMVQSGLLKREGDRRWSRYALA